MPDWYIGGKMNNILFKKTIRDMKSAWAQSLALAIIIALGITGLISMDGSYRDLSTSYNYVYSILHFADVDFSIRAAPESVVGKVVRTKGVKAATGRLIIDTGYDLPSGEPIRARFVGLPMDDQPAVDSIHINEGRYFRPGDTNVVVLESHFAKVYDLHPGDEVTPIVNGKKLALKVIGVASSPEYLIVSRSKQDVLPSPRTFAVLFAPLPEVQRLFGMEGKIDDIVVLLAPGVDRDETIGGIREVLSPYGIASITPREHQPSNEALGLDLEGFKETAYLVPALMLFVAAMAVYIMLSRAVHAQRPQIGLMKALGYSDGVVMLHYLSYAMAIGIVGSVLGILAGQPLGMAITKVYAGELGIPLVKTSIYPDLWAGGLLLMSVFVVLGSIGPARASAKVPPAIAMRFDPSAVLVKGRESIVERLIRLPFWLRLPVRDVFRVRRRSIGTGLGVIFSIMLVVLGFAFMDSMNFLLDRGFEQNWDMLAQFSTPQTEQTEKEVASWKGVKYVEEHIEIPVTIKANGKEQSVLLYAVEPDTKMPPIKLVGRTKELSSALSGNRIVLTEYMAKKMGLREGDEVEVSTPFGSMKLEIGGTSREYITAVAYVSLERVQKMVGMKVFNALYLDVAPEQRVEIEKKLYHLPGAANVQIKEGMMKDIRSFMGLYDAFVGIIFLFAVTLAFALLFNTMTVSVLERQREYATMRAIGASGGRIAWLITMESLILWALTVVPGLVLGWLVSYYAVGTFNSDLFVFYLRIEPLSYVLSAASILIVMLLSAMPAVRHVNRLSLAEAIKMIT